MKNKNYLLCIFLFAFSLSIFAQRDTIDYSVHSWKVNSFLESKDTELDTFLHAFQLYNPIQKKTYGYAMLGTVGQPYQHTLFDSRTTNSFLFLSPYHDYLFTPQNARFFNTKQQYTDIRYVTNFSKNNNLQNLKILHTQNILPNLNFGVEYRLLGALGEYRSQKTNDHFFRAFSSYQHKNYQAYLTYHYNKINCLLNGGIQSDTLLNNPDYEISDNKLIPINLEDSKNSILNRNINLKHSFSFKEHPLSVQDTNRYKQGIMRWRIGHELDWNYNKRVYSNTGNSGFYQTFSSDTSAIRGDGITDSINYQNFKNTFFVQLLDDTLSPLLPSVVVAYSLDNNSYYSYNEEHTENKHWVQFKVSNPVYNNLFWSVKSQYELKSSDVKSNIAMTYIFGKNNHQSIHFSGHLSKQTPDLFYRHYNSSFYSWNNSDFKQTDKSHLDLHYKNEKLKLKVGISQSNYKHLVYIGSSIQKAWINDSTSTIKPIYGFPKQYNKSFGLFKAYIQHQLDWGKIHMYNAFAFQQISENCPIHLPKLQWYNSTYFQTRFFKKVMTFQIGLDIHMNSSYYIDGFMPATGLFYVQNQKKYGSYPYIDAFVNLKIKRLRMSFKLEHLNKGLSGNEYYTIYQHPMTPRVFRLGLSWRFYN